VAGKLAIFILGDKNLFSHACERWDTFGFIFLFAFILRYDTKVAIEAYKVNLFLDFIN
jgi:hypothetical protein